MKLTFLEWKAYYEVRLAEMFDFIIFSAEIDYCSSLVNPPGFMIGRLFSNLLGTFMVI